MDWLYPKQAVEANVFSHKTESIPATIEIDSFVYGNDIRENVGNWYHTKYIRPHPNVERVLS